MKSFLLIATAVMLAACTASAPPEIVAGTDPSSPSARAKPVKYAPVTAGTVVYRPVEPKPWLEQNKQVAPKTEGE